MVYYLFPFNFLFFMFNDVGNIVKFCLVLFLKERFDGTACEQCSGYDTYGPDCNQSKFV